MSAISDADDGGHSCTRYGNRLGIPLISSIAIDSHSHLTSTHVCKCPTAYDWGHARMLFAGTSPGFKSASMDACATDVFQQGEAMLRANWQTVEVLALDGNANGAMLRADWQTMSIYAKWQQKKAPGNPGTL